MPKEKSKIETLKDFLFLRAQNKRINEPWNYAINQISHEVRLFELQSEYASEICRILKELKLTTDLLKGTFEIKTDELIDMEDEDRIIYFQGILLHLTHQMKDKLLKLVYFLMEGEETTEKLEKLICQNNLSLSKLLKLKSAKIKDAGLNNFLEVWDQNSKSGIGITLQKRSDYHHRLSNLHLRKPLQDYKSAKIMLNGSSLSERGKQYFIQLKDNSFKEWHEEANKFAKNTLEEINKNIDSIVEVLMEHYNFVPFTEKEITAFSERYSTMLESFEIKNETSKSNIPKSMLELISNGISNLPLLKNNVETIYMIGSIPRGDYNPKWSDMNIVIILKNNCSNRHIIEEVQKQVIGNKPDFNVQFIEKDQFSNESTNSTKLRFICKYDGVVVYGEELVKEEKFPDAGMNLALLLNHDLIDNISTYENWLKENPNPSESTIQRKSLEIAKRTIDFLFGIAITNQPFYTSNREKRINHINKVFPEKIKITGQYSGILNNKGVGTKEELELLLEVLKSKEGTFKYMEKTKAEIDAKRRK